MKTPRGFTIIELIVVMAIFLFIIGAAISVFLSIIQNQKKVLSEAQLLNQIGYVEEYMSKALRAAQTADDVLCINQGYIYQLKNYDNTSGIFKGIKFLNQSDNDASGKPSCQKFFLDKSVDDPTSFVLKEIKTYYPYPEVLDSQAVPLTSTNLKIKSIKFSINGNDGSTVNLNCPDIEQCGALSNINGTEPQPRVTITLEIIIPGDNQNIGKICNIDNDDNCSADQVCDLSIKKCVPTRTIQTTISRRNLNIIQ